MPGINSAGPACRLANDPAVAILLGEQDAAAVDAPLVELTLSLLPDNAEAAGLLALLWLCESRQAARHGPQGESVPLHQQDCALYDKTRIAHADQIL